MTIDEDASISRVHAELVVKPLLVESSPTTPPPRVLLKDLSKFGTFVEARESIRRSKRARNLRESPPPAQHSRVWMQETRAHHREVDA